MGCVADTSSFTNPKRPDTVRAETPTQPSPAPTTVVAPAPTPEPTPNGALPRAGPGASSRSAPLRRPPSPRTSRSSTTTGSSRCPPTTPRVGGEAPDVHDLRHAAEGRSPPSSTGSADHGYTTILPRDLAAHWDDGSKLPARPVIITFDDGSRDWVDPGPADAQGARHGRRVLPDARAIEHGNLTWKEVRSSCRGRQRDRRP